MGKPDDSAATPRLSVLVVNFEMDPHSPVLAWQVNVVAALSQRCSKVLVLTHRRGPISSCQRMSSFG